MNIGFDVTDTITRYPKQCKALIDSLHKDGWKIFVVSPNAIDTIENDLFLTKIDKEKVEIIVSRDKWVVCKEKEIDIFLDDLDDYLDPMLENKLDIMPLKVKRKDML